MTENLRDEINEALIEEAMRGGCDWTDAVLGVVGPELDRLRAMVSKDAERWLEQRGLAVQMAGRAAEAEAERDVLRARLAKVEALADSMGTRLRVGGLQYGKSLAGDFVADLRAALASVPEPSDSEPAPRPSTPPTPTADGRTHMTVHRSCNGCGRDLGDANDDELNAAVAGHTLPDVRRECGCDDSKPAPCRCHDTHAAITARHEGHCCFYPADRKCHQTEVEAWAAAHRALTEPAPDADREAGERP